MQVLVILFAIKLIARINLLKYVQSSVPTNQRNNLNHFIEIEDSDYFCINLTHFFSIFPYRALSSFWCFYRCF